MNDDYAHRQSLTLWLLCAAQFMLVLDLAIVNVALPSMQRTLGLSSEALQWVVGGYALTFGGFLMLGGRLADVVGRRRMFVIGLVLLILATMVGGFSQSGGMLIAGRVSQGFAAKLGSGTLIAVGTLAIAAGLLLFLRTNPGSGFITVLIPAMLVTGVGMGLGFVGVTMAATTGVPDPDQGIASGLINTCQQVGTAVGLAILVTIASSVTRASHAQPAAAVVAGYHVAFVVAAATAAGAALIALIVLKRPSALPADPAGTVSPRLMQPLTAAATEERV